MATTQRITYMIDGEPVDSDYVTTDDPPGWRRAREDDPPAAPKHDQRTMWPYTCRICELSMYRPHLKVGDLTYCHACAWIGQNMHSSTPDA